MAKILESPTVRFTQKAYQQICCLTDECPIEVSAMGVIATEQQRRDWGIDERFYIMEFHVPDQTCSAASTVMETDSLSELAFSLRDKGINSEQVCVWWHSHVNMDTGHSGTDEKQIEDFDFDEVCISLITNKKGDLNCRVDLYNPIRFSFEDCDWCVDQINIIEDGWAKQMIKEHVSQSAPVRLNVVKAPEKKPLGAYWNPGSSGNNWGRHHWDDYGTDSFSTENKTYGAPDPDPEPEVPDIKFPTELVLLEELYFDRIVTAQEAMEFYGRWYAREVSTAEIEDELHQLYYEKDDTGGQTKKVDEELEEDPFLVSDVKDIDDIVTTPKVCAIAGGSE